MKCTLVLIKDVSVDVIAYKLLIICEVQNMKLRDIPVLQNFAFFFHLYISYYKSFNIVLYKN